MPATVEAPAFTPVLLINIRYPEEKVAFTEETTFKGRVVKEITGDHAQFINTQYLATSQEEVDHLLAACPYLFIEPTEGELFEDPKHNFATRNVKAYQAWMNSEWRNAKEEGA